MSPSALTVLGLNSLKILIILKILTLPPKVGLIWWNKDICPVEVSSWAHHPGFLLQSMKHKSVESQSPKCQKSYDLKVLALLFWLQKQLGVTRSDGNVSAWLKLILPCESPEQHFTSDKMHCVSTPAHVLHLREQDLCVHLDACVHVTSGGMTNVHRYHRYWYPTGKCISLLYLLKK